MEAARGKFEGNSDSLRGIFRPAPWQHCASPGIHLIPQFRSPINRSVFHLYSFRRRNYRLSRRMSREIGALENVKDTSEPGGVSWPKSRRRANSHLRRAAPVSSPCLVYLLLPSPFSYSSPIFCLNGS
ncbi:Hypothetical protein NTJ_04408 [Nesidiocoris tenuis]|uniref:Uncharacterized protein n=1 Tax=Nesidiocoris tenuis TaxID=355587 RepID=A0ABN7AH60_9HEMI|nr:Hypothetical protein NTJ_04408 [Nesidiocoris tenuis]